MRRPSLPGMLAGIGFANPTAGEAVLQRLPGGWSDDYVPALEDFRLAPSPDAALDGLVELARAARDAGDDSVRQLLTDDEARRSLIRVLGASRGIATIVARMPEVAKVAASPREPRSADEYRESLRQAVAGVTGQEAVRALRREYRCLLVEIAAFDLAAEEPSEVQPAVSAALADLAGATLDAALELAKVAARERFGERADSVRLAVIAMGKTGARELNYLSDVDVIWVHEADDLEPHRTVQIAEFLARETSAVCARPDMEPPLWEVDANLRPEGKDGALSRTLASHVGYYERWAKNWEFQALVKARAIAGDAELGRAYEEAMAPFVWGSATRPDFVESVQAMRQRVTDLLDPDEAPRHIKLGQGGLRDIEFTVQLLQLVHGARDERLRVRDTLGAIDVLAEWGYIGRDDGAAMAMDYRFLRVLEHRVQLAGLTRTHLMPESDLARRALARAVGLGDADSLEREWQRVRRDVRSLHDRIFYRPLLQAVAALPGDTALTGEDAAERLRASGFRDPKEALQHIAALTKGVARRVQMHRTLMPVMLGWFAAGPDPDAGLLRYRRLSEALGESPWYLGMLRDHPVAAQRLAFLLTSAKFVGTLMESLPQSAAWIGNDVELQPRAAEVLLEEALGVVQRADGDRERVRQGLRGIRRRELLRTSMASALGLADPMETGRTLTMLAGVLLDAALAQVAPEREFELAIIAMGRTGGAELALRSDIDVMYVCRGQEGAVQAATSVVREVADLVTDPMVPLELDAGLRPEGAKGPLVRSLESYAQYYSRWSETWEAQALLRAAPLAGDAALSADFTALIDPLRYTTAFEPQDAREIRRMKARVEAERLPRGADPTRHLKLGRGSLSDVEWLVQLLQLEHAAAVGALRTTGTVDALRALAHAELIEPEEAQTLERAWMLASRIRNALALAEVRDTNVLPADRVQLETCARLLGYPAGSATALEADYLQVTRRARHVFERCFYGL